jgi:histone H3/H4
VLSQQKKVFKAPVQNKKRWRPGTVALRQIRKYQKSTDVLIPRKSFERLVREIASTMTSDGVRFKKDALRALQEGTEQYLVSLFQDTQKCSLHAKHQTITKSDMKLASEMRGYNFLKQDNNNIFAIGIPPKMHKKQKRNQAKILSSENTTAGNDQPSNTDVSEDNLSTGTDVNGNDHPSETVVGETHNPTDMEVTDNDQASETEVNEMDQSNEPEEDNRETNETSQSNEPEEDDREINETDTNKTEDGDRETNETELKE